MRKLLYPLLLLTLLLLPAPAAQAAEYYLADGSGTTDEIAARMNCDAELLAAINNLSGGDRPTGLLRLPEQPQLLITVAAGDTLYALARSHGVDARALAAANGLEDPYTLYPGQQLCCPLAEEQAALRLSADTDRLVEALAPLASRAGQRETNWQWPLDGLISSYFGERERGWHYGLDIAADSGTPVMAAAAGRVTEAAWKNDAYGYAVMLQHEGGYQTLYAHCSQLLVREGDTVAAGEAVARVGSTGNSTGPHLHFEIRADGSCLDPLPLLP